MSAELEKWVQEALDGKLSAESQAALNDVLRVNDAALAAYCAQVRMHALLAWRSGAAMTASPSAAETVAAVELRKVVPLPKRPRIWRWAAAAAAALIMFGAVFIALAPGNAAAALARVMEAMQHGDRSYRIAVIRGDARQTMNNGNSVTYEGAELHLRGDSQFVLVRPVIEGGQRITGSDGTENWDFGGNGPVKVSRDLTRFRGGLPGEQQDAVFLDLRGQLSRLQPSYDISLADVSGDADLAVLKAERKSRDVRGPNKMQITFRRKSGVIVTLEMHGLPRARGGPEALRLTLTSDATLPPDFFNHSAHHEPFRRVEDADRPAARP